MCMAKYLRCSTALVAVALMLSTIVMAQPQPASQWSFNVSDSSGPLNWGTILNTDGDVLYDACFMDDFPAPRRFHNAAYGNVDSLSQITLEYLISSSFRITVEDQGGSRPALSVKPLDVQCTVQHPETGVTMALQRIDFLLPAENEMGYINALELHLVHAQLNSSNLPIPNTVQPEFIIAVFFDVVITGGTAEISKILARAPSTTGTFDVTDLTLDATMLFPAKRDYIFYKGFIPRPPCDVVAHYALFTQNLYLSNAQLQAIRYLLFGPTYVDDQNQRNSGIVSLRNKVALNAQSASYSYFIASRFLYPLEMPPDTEPMSSETKLAIASFAVSCLAGLVGLSSLIFSLCRPRTKISKKDEAAMAVTVVAAAQH